MDEAGIALALLFAIIVFGVVSCREDNANALTVKQCYQKAGGDRLSKMECQILELKYKVTAEEDEEGAVTEMMLGTGTILAASSGRQDA